MLYEVITNHVPFVSADFFPIRSTIHRRGENLRRNENVGELVGIQIPDPLLFTKQLCPAIDDARIRKLVQYFGSFPQVGWMQTIIRVQRKNVTTLRP